MLAAALALVAAMGCFELDPFLYARTRTDAYLLPAEGETPGETVDPARITPLRLHTADGVELGAAYVASAVAPPKAYMVHFHGQCCHLDTHIGRAKQLANLGYGVLVFDYRGWGTSTDVRPTEAGILEDSRAAIAWLEQYSGLPASRLVYYGRSFGGAVATQAAVDKPPAVLVLESTFTSVQGLVRDSGQMDIPAGYVAEDTWDTLGRLKQLQGVSLLLFHGTADDFVRYEFSEELYAAANPPKRLVPAPGADHSTVPTVLGAAWGQALDEVIGPTAAANN
jgi:uncharacterized protein